MDATPQAQDDEDWARLLAAARRAPANPPAASAAPGATTARSPASAPVAQPARPAAPALLDLYGPLLDAPRDGLLLVGHLGQSLDGFIATDGGDSRFITGHDNILHLHRMRALCDAVIVGAGTVAADDPRLTTREVAGPNPLRVVLDPRRRLAPHHQLFNDGAAPTLLVHAADVAAAAPTGVETLALPAGVDGGLDLPALVAALQSRGCRRAFVEGGARTVAGFLQAGLLARLQVAVAPLLIGSGRPSIRLPGAASLSGCLRVRHRVFRMGTDMLFDLDLAQRRDGGTPSAERSGLQRVV